MFRALSLFFMVGITQFAAAQQFPDTTAEAPPASIYSVTIDAVYLLVGAVSPGVDIPIADHWSVAADMTTGSMLFVKVNSMYSAGVRYYLPSRKFRGMYISSMYYSVDAEYNTKQVKAGGLLLIGGYRWKIHRLFVLDVSGGLNLSPTTRQTFEETSGNLTKSVSLGGSGFTVNVRFGIGL